LQGGGDLSADRTLSITQATISSSGYLSSTDWNTFNNKQNALSGGILNRITKWTSTTGIGNSQIADDGTSIAIGASLNSTVQLGIATNKATALKSSSSTGIGINGISTNSTGGTGVKGESTGGYGLFGSSNSTTVDNVGVYGSATDSVSLNIGGKFVALGTSGSKYSVQLQDGTESAGKFLKSITADGKANWANITSSDISGISGSYVPYTGATANVNIGVYSVIANNGTYNTEMSPSYFGVQNTAETIFGLLEYNKLTITNSTIPSTMEMNATGLVFPNGSIQTTAATGTVTSVAALTLGTTGTDISSTVATGTTTPVITLNIPTASATNRGALSAANWTDFNNKTNGSGTANYLPLWSNSNTLATSAVYQDPTTSNIGIGTSTPTVDLHIARSTTENFYISLANSAGPLGETTTTDTTKRSRLIARNDVNTVSIGQIGTTNTAGVTFGAPGDSYLASSDTAQNLNILTQTANNGTTTDHIEIFAGISGNVATTTPSMIILGSDIAASTASLNVVPAKGNVGIGTAIPISKLHVVGSLKVDSSGTVTVPASSPGWYRLANFPIAGGSRGGLQLTYSVTGGNLTPVTYVIKAYKTSSTTVGTLILEKYGSVTYMQKIRLVADEVTPTLLHIEALMLSNVNPIIFQTYVEKTLGYEGGINVNLGTLSLSTSTANPIRENSFIEFSGGISAPSFQIQNNILGNRWEFRDGSLNSMPGVLNIVGSSSNIIMSLDDTNTRVGIGTVSYSPTAKLHVNNITSSDSFLVEDSTNPDSNPFVIDSSGNVGVNFSTPATLGKLVVQGNGANGLVLNTDSGTATNSTRLFFRQSDGNDVSMFNVNGSLRFSFNGTTNNTSGDSKFIMTAAGSLLINATSPTLSPAAPLTTYATGTASAEEVARFSAYDVNNPGTLLSSYMSIRNGTSTDSEFIPQLRGLQATASTLAGLDLISLVPDTATTNASFLIRATNTSGGAIINRPSFEIRNAASVIMGANYNTTYSNNYIGFGHNSPTAKVHVRSGLSQIGLKLDKTSTSIQSFEFENSDSGNEIRGFSEIAAAKPIIISNTTNSNNEVPVSGSLDIVFNILGNRIATIADTGNVGIGVNTPSTKLHINSATSGAFKLSDTTEAIGRVLTCDADGLATWEDPSIPVIAGAANRVAIYTNDGLLSYDGEFSYSSSTNTLSITSSVAEGSEGTTSISPGRAVLLRTDDAEASLAIATRSNTATTTSALNFIRRRGTTTASNYLAGDILGQITFKGLSDTNITSITAIATVNEATGTSSNLIFKAGGATENLRLLDNNAVRISNVYTLPTIDGSTNQVLTTNGSGTISWANTPATPSLSDVMVVGNNTESKNIIFNSGYGLDDSSNRSTLRFDSSDQVTITNTKTLVGSTNKSALLINGGNIETSISAEKVTTGVSISIATSYVCDTYSDTSVQFVDIVANNAYNTNLNISKSAMLIGSTLNSSFIDPDFRGAEYLHNYASNYTNRSLVDKEYVDTAVSTVTVGTTASVSHTVKAGIALTKGQAVFVSSADGTNMIVSKADYSLESTSSKVMGLIAQNLSLNGIGQVITEGLLAGLDTSTAGSAGAPVWLGDDGNLLYGLANKPSAPNHLVFIGIVTRVNANNGEIFIKPQNGFEVHELHDVSIDSIADNDVLTYETVTGLWKNKPQAFNYGLSYTVATQNLLY
jgi:hypothetical protein